MGGQDAQPNVTQHTPRHMPDQAKVTELMVLRQVRAALAEFAETATSALGAAQSNVQRAAWWLQHDRPAHWQAERRRRTAKLSQAQAELFRAQVAPPDQRGSAILERKAVERAKRDLEEAETKLRNLKRWRPAFEREALLFRAQCQALAHAAENDLPKAMARLDAMLRALEKYVKLAAPTVEEPPDAQGVGSTTPSDRRQEADG